jgi:hypothetical protein
MIVNEFVQSTHCYLGIQVQENILGLGLFL